MRDVLRVLRDLQELDEDLYRVRQELERLPAERTARREEIDAKLQRMKELDSETLQLRMQVKEIEDASKAARQRIRQLENASATTRSDQALLAAYSHEIRSLKREISEGDDEGLRIVERVDAKQAERDALGSEVQEEETVHTEFSANVEKELAEAQKKHDKLNAERNKRMGESVPPDVLGVYEKLLDARAGMALAALEDRNCQGCYMNVPTNVFVRLSKGREIVQCPNCQRILFLYD